MAAAHVVFLVEERSMEAFLRALLPRVLPLDRSFEIHPFQCKPDLLLKIEARLRAYAKWLPSDWRIVVLVDRDDDDCRVLKRRLETIARRAGLITRHDVGGGAWQLVNRIAVEELEAWYFGDWEAVCAAYARTARTVPQRSGYREPDAIAGGTWEAFERVMRKCGYFQAGLQKIEAARAIGGHIDPQRSTSASFRALMAAVSEAVADTL